MSEDTVPVVRDVQAFTVSDHSHIHVQASPTVLLVLRYADEATLVGFNLPADVSRGAPGHEDHARAPVRGDADCHHRRRDAAGGPTRSPDRDLRRYRGPRPERNAPAFPCTWSASTPGPSDERRTEPTPPARLGAGSGGGEQRAVRQLTTEVVMRSILSSLTILLSSSLILAQPAPAALLLVSLPGRVEAASQQGIPPDFVLVSGAEDPTKIPSYLAWQDAFRLLATIDDKNLRDLKKSLPFGPHMRGSCTQLLEPSERSTRSAPLGRTGRSLRGGKKGPPRKRSTRNSLGSPWNVGSRLLTPATTCSRR